MLPVFSLDIRGGERSRIVLVVGVPLRGGGSISLPYVALRLSVAITLLA